jgi:hypothetical protein
MHVASFTLYAFVYNNKELLQSQQYKRKDNWASTKYYFFGKSKHLGNEGQTQRNAPVMMTTKLLYLIYKHTCLCSHN